MPSLSKSYLTKKGVKTPEELNAEIAQKRKIANQEANLAAGDYPGKVNTPYTIGALSAVPGTLPEGQTQATFKNEAEYQKLAAEKRAGLQQQAIEQQKQLQELQKPVEEVQQTPEEQQAQQEPSIAQKVLSTRIFQPLGISGFSAAIEALKNPKEAIKQAGVETAIGASVGIGGTGFGAIRAGNAIGANIAAKTFSTATAAKALSLFSLKTLITGGVIAAVGRRKAAEADSVLSQSLSGMEETIQAVKNGEISPELASQLLDEYEAHINSAEKSVKTLSQLDVFNFIGLKDSLARYKYARLPTGIPAIRRQLDIANVQNQLAQTRAGISR